MVTGDPRLPDPELLRWHLRQPPDAECDFAQLRPNFLVISPPKTGSTWLADNLRSHPDLFIPAVKEIKYFSSWFKWFDLGWYFRHFEGAAGRLKGEASPSYAALPGQRIRLIRQLMPDIKLIFLMRDPISRAWSHAKHNHCFGEANFANRRVDFEAISDDEWTANFAHDWPLTSGDYLGQLRRWLSVFPREQVFVGFYESIARDPEALLRSLFAFLGAHSDVDLSAFPVRERILAGHAGRMSSGLRARLHSIVHGRSCELVAFLKDQLGLTPPPEWQETLTPPPDSSCNRPAVFEREFDDGFLAQVASHEQSFPGPARILASNYRGFSITLHRGRLIALSESLGNVCISDMGAADLDRLQDNRQCFAGSTLGEVMNWIDQFNFERTQAQDQQIAGLQQKLDEAQARLVRIEGNAQDGEAAFRAVLNRLAQVENNLASLGPGIWLAQRVFWPLWRRVRRWRSERYNDRKKAEFFSAVR
jgi:hypothetical protein